MGLFKILLQCGLHALQLGGAIAACGTSIFVKPVASLASDER